jgi:D-amino-acid dehydrogenase
MGARNSEQKAMLNRPASEFLSSTDTAFDVIVLGAGIVGINTAYWAMRAGRKVCVVDRQPGAGLETSFANGGQISVSHAEPWANPSAPLKILKWLFDGRSPLLFRPRMDIHQWLWIAQFLVDCLPQRADRHTTEIVRLATESRRLLGEIRQRENLQYDQRCQGILHFYRDQREFDAAIRVAELMRGHGCNRKLIGRSEVLAIEPAFEDHINDIVGATYTRDDESGDAHKYSQGLAKVCADKGVAFFYGSTVVALEVEKSGQRVASAEIRTPFGYQHLRGRDIVVCLGSYSAPFLRPYGIRLNIYPAKGYSVTIPIDATNRAPTTSLTDDQYKLVYSNLGDRLRIAGTAELSGYSCNLNVERCNAILDNVRALFPEAGDFTRPSFWAGLRPTTPSNVPYVGSTPYRNLWLNTGHGTLGWTLGAGSGKRIVDMMMARQHAS